MWKNGNPSAWIAQRAVVLERPRTPPVPPNRPCRLSVPLEPMRHSPSPGYRPANPSGPDPKSWSWFWFFLFPLARPVSLVKKADSPHIIGCCYINHQRKGIRNDRSTGFAWRSTSFVAIGSHQTFCQTNRGSSNAMGKKLVRQSRRLGGNGAGDRRTLPPGSRPVGGGSVRQDHDPTGHGGKGGSRFKKRRRSPYAHLNHVPYSSACSAG